MASTAEMHTTSLTLRHVLMCGCAWHVQLNPFVMGTWTNPRMVGIDQDIGGIAAVRVDTHKQVHCFFSG